MSGSDLGKIEGLITIENAQGWDVEVIDGTGTDDVNIPMGTYFASSPGPGGANSFIDEFAAQLNATMTDSFTVTHAASESSRTNLVTITNTSANNTTFNWTTGVGGTEIRDILGFNTDGNLSGSTAYTSSGTMRGCWLPPVPGLTLNGTSYPVSDFRTNISSNGSVYSFKGNEYDQFEIEWDTVTRKLTWLDNEVVDGESFERFWTGFVWGNYSFAEVGTILRYYADADLATGEDFRYAGQDRIYRPDQVRETYAGLWRIVIDRLVGVP